MELPQHCPVVIGAGLAGLMTALDLAPMNVLVVCAAKLGEEAASAWAQGGLAAAVTSGDSAELHANDTIMAGDGLCDPQVVRTVVREAPLLVERLTKLGARFDRDDAGKLICGLEAGHARRRIVHAHGDGSGREILRAVIAAACAAPSITIAENTVATRLLTQAGQVVGVQLRARDGDTAVIHSNRVVMATGGAGALYGHTTNPTGAIGHGMILAAQAGAALADMEFVQFHPTALAAGRDPMPLISEAVRGEGAVLIDDTGCRFMEGQGRAELEPRDVVSRAVWRHMMAGHQKIYLDARHCLGRRFGDKFPQVAALCRAAGIDPATQPIPVRPAAHYMMGGIAATLDGRTSLPGLWACGEAASTGLHGANRLASNSLLEAGVMAQFVARDMGGVSAGRFVAPDDMQVPMLPHAGMVRSVMSQYAFVMRDRDGLRTAIAALLPHVDTQAHDAAPASLALMMCVAMLRREESRGGHARRDFAARRDDMAQRLTLTLDQARALAAHEIAT